MVDPHHPALDPAGDCTRPGYVAAEPPTAEPVRRVVRQGDRLVIVLYPVDDRDRSEQLFAKGAHRRRHADEDRGLHERSGVVGAPATEYRGQPDFQSASVKRKSRPPSLVARWRD